MFQSTINQILGIAAAGKKASDIAEGVKGAKKTPSPEAIATKDYKVPTSAKAPLIDPNDYSYMSMIYNDKSLQRGQWTINNKSKQKMKFTARLEKAMGGKVNG